MKLVADEAMWHKYISLQLKGVYRSLSDAYAECDSSSYINLDEIDRRLEEFCDELAGRMANLCGAEEASRGSKEKSTRSN